jgi:hypothetical protein
MFVAQNRLVVYQTWTHLGQVSQDQKTCEIQPIQPSTTDLHLGFSHQQNFML